MAQLKLDLSSFKSSGVYTVEVDNTIQHLVDTDALRMVAGFSERPPFNRPIFFNSKADKEKIYGSSINTKLERKGCFYERFLDILLESGPVIGINLLNVNDNDKVGFSSFPLAATENTEHEAHMMPYTEFFDRSRFWTLSTSNLNQVASSKRNGTNDPVTIQSSMYKSSIFNIVNTSTSDITVFLIKDTDVLGYNVTAEKWYEGQPIPYGWIDKEDYMSEYFVKLVVVKGNWTSFSSLSKDLTWSKYFNDKGLIATEVNKFINADGVSLVGAWSGAIIPNFYNKAGSLVSLDSIVNSYADQTGIMIAFNEDAMESLYNNGSSIGQVYDSNYSESVDEDDAAATYMIDMVGRYVREGNSGIKFLSYVNGDASDIIETVKVNKDANEADNEFVIFAGTNNYLSNITVGMYVETKTGLTRIIKKSYDSTLQNYTFTCLSDINKLEKYNDEDGKFVTIHKSLQSAFTTIAPICLSGLKLTEKHRPGYDENGNYSLEGGVEKIYSMLSNEGIRRGLKNKDMISFRYIIDSLAGGLDSGLGGKSHLATLAKEVGKCTAIVNFPSVTEMAMSTDPLFCDATAQNSISKNFDTKFIPTGGNQDAHCSKPLTLPTKDEGADYIGIFSPFLKYRTGNRTILIPPAAHVANAFNVKYNGGDPYATIANTNGILNDSDVIGVEYQYDDQDRDNLEPFGVNPIILQNGKTMIYGNRTAYQDVLSDLNYLHVRELLNTIEIECEAVLKNYVFRANNSITRAEIVRKLNPILEDKLTSGALYSYNIICDETNNTAEIINKAFGIVDISVVCTKNMEKIVQRIIIDKLSE